MVRLGASLLRRKKREEPEVVETIEEAPPPGPPLVLLVPDVGGVSSFRQHNFQTAEQAAEFIVSLHGEKQRGVHAFWALQQEIAGTPGEAMVLIRSAQSPDIVYVVSFVDIDSAQSFARFEVKRGLQLHLLAIYFAALVTLDIGEEIILTPAEPPSTAFLSRQPNRSSFVDHARQPANGHPPPSAGPPEPAVDPRTIEPPPVETVVLRAQFLEPTVRDVPAPSSPPPRTPVDEELPRQDTPAPPPFLRAAPHEPLALTEDPRTETDAQPSEPVRAGLDPPPTRDAESRSRLDAETDPEAGHDDQPGVPIPPFLRADVAQHWAPEASEDVPAGPVSESLPVTAELSQAVGHAAPEPQGCPAESAGEVAAAAETDASPPDLLVDGVGAAPVQETIAPTEAESSQTAVTAETVDEPPITAPVHEPEPDTELEIGGSPHHSEELVADAEPENPVASAHVETIEEPLTASSAHGLEPDAESEIDDSPYQVEEIIADVEPENLVAPATTETAEEPLTALPAHEPEPDTESEIDGSPQHVDAIIADVEPEILVAPATTETVEEPLTAPPAQEPEPDTESAIDGPAQHVDEIISDVEPEIFVAPAITQTAEEPLTAPLAQELETESEVESSPNHIEDVVADVEADGAAAPVSAEPLPHPPVTAPAPEPEAPTELAVAGRADITQTIDGAADWQPGDDNPLLAEARAQLANPEAAAGTLSAPVADSPSTNAQPADIVASPPESPTPDQPAQTKAPDVAKVSAQADDPASKGRAGKVDVAKELESVVKKSRWTKRESPFQGFDSPPGRF